jgi:hypothetical protein
MSIEEYRETLIRKLKILNETVWEGRANAPHINQWLENFDEVPTGEGDEQLHALYLLRHFMYFGDRQIRALLKALYRDLFKYPIVEQIRKRNADTTDAAFLLREFDKELQKTRFVGIGNPAESGTHLLYPFRQVNDLPPELFIDSTRVVSPHTFSNQEDEINRYVFIDDLCGSGEQAEIYTDSFLEKLKAVKPEAYLAYHLLIATTDGLRRLRENTLFNSVDCVIELDETFKCFSPESRYFQPTSHPINPEFAEKVCRKYGQRLYPQDPLGGGGAQLLIGFSHNTPDNSLPIFWFDDPPVAPWTPIFKRYRK